MPFPARVTFRHAALAMVLPVESQKAKAGGFLASHSDSRPCPVPTRECPDRAARSAARHRAR